MAWIRDPGVPQALFSDTARHFQNRAVGQLETALGLEHGTSIAYAKPRASPTRKPRALEHGTSIAYAKASCADGSIR